MSTTTYLQVSFGRNLEVPMESANTRHSVTLSTIHANSAQQDVARFTSRVLQSGADLPYRAIKTNIADSLTNFTLPPEEIWRDYNRRADMENRIAELKHDLAADDFCMQVFFATEAAFRSILLLFNLLGEFQRACRFTSYRQPAALRAQVFLCGALLGRAGRCLVLHLSTSWGCLQQRIPLLENILTYGAPTSPKLHPDAAT